MKRRDRTTLLPLLIFILAAATVFSACGGDDEGAAAPTGDVPDSGTVAPTAVPDTATDPAPVEAMGDPVVERLIISTAAPTVETNNPWRYESPRGPWFFALTNESLLAGDADTGEHVPQLAESWTIEPDGVSVRWKLREGVRFHGDNGDFTSADLVAMIANHSADDSRHSHRSQYRAVTPEVVNDYEVVYRISKSNPEILNNSSSWNVISGEPYSAKDMEALGGDPDLTSRPPAGTGAYQFLERNQGVDFVVERVDYEHWRYQPDWEEVEIRFSSEASTRLASLLTEEIHVTVLPLDLQNQAEEAGMAVATGQVLTRERSGMFQGPILDKNYADYEAQGTACGYANCEDALLDVRVRKALAKAVDRGAINNAFFGGKGVEVHNPHFVPTRSYWNPEWDQNFEAEYGYNPVEAMQLLAEAGFGPNNPLEILIDGVPSGGLAEKADQAETLLGYFRDVGIDAELDARDAATTRAISRVFGHTNRLTFMGSNIYETQAFRVHHHSGTTPRGGPEFRGLDEAITQQRSTVDPVKALDGLRQVGDVSFPLHIALPLFWVPDDIIFNPDIVASYERSGVPLGVFHSIQQIRAVRK